MASPAFRHETSLDLILNATVPLCAERRRLLAEYSAAVGVYAAHAAKLSTLVGINCLRDYMALLEKTDQMRLAAHDGCRALEQHKVVCGCE